MRTGCYTSFPCLSYDKIYNIKVKISSKQIILRPKHPNTYFIENEKTQWMLYKNNVFLRFKTQVTLIFHQSTENWSFCVRNMFLSNYRRCLKNRVDWFLEHPVQLIVCHLVNNKKYKWPWSSINQLKTDCLVFETCFYPTIQGVWKIVRTDFQSTLYN